MDDLEKGYTPVEPPQSAEEDKYDRMNVVYGDMHPDAKSDTDNDGFVERNNTRDRL